MPFARPSLAQLVTRIRADLRGSLEIGGPILRRAMTDVLGAVWAGGIHLLYGYLDWLARQLFADTAEREQLFRTADLYGIDPDAATFAVGNVTITGSSGTVLAGEVLQLDAATLYTVTTGATLSSGTGTIVVTAALAGAAANLPVGATLTFQSPTPGVNATATVTTGGPSGDGIAGGDDGDAGDPGTERVRSRLLLRLREPPSGGAQQDYIEWVLGAAGAGATRVFPIANANGLGTVVAYFVDDNESPIIPSGGQVTAAQAALDAHRPITAVATAFAPTSLAVAFTIHLAADTSDARAAVTSQLGALLARIAAPGDGVSRGKVLLSAIRTAIGLAVGDADYTLTAPSADVVPGVGQMPTLGTITFT